MNNAKEKIKEVVSIANILAEWYSVTPDAKGRGPCPFCKYPKDKKVFWVSQDGQHFTCHHCKKGGDVFTLVMELENLDFMTALKKLAAYSGVEIELNPEQEKELKMLSERAAALHRFTQYWHKKLTKDALQYLLSRKIRIEYINSHSIGYIPGQAIYPADKKDFYHLKKMGLMSDQKNVNPKWWCRLFVTFRKNGQIVYFVGRGINDKIKPVQLLPSLEEMGNKPVLGVGNGDRVLMVEGVFDFLTADQELESKNLLGILGNSKVFDLPPKIKTIDLCFDWDKAGFSYIDKYGLDFVKQEKKVNVVTRPADLPVDKNDLNDYVQVGGKIQDLKTISLAEWYIEQLKSDPTNESIKEKFFKSLQNMGEIDTDRFLTRVHKEIYKNQGVDKRSIKKEFALFLVNQEKAREPGSFIDEVSGKTFVLPQGYMFGGDRLMNIDKGEIITAKRMYISRLMKDHTEGETYCEIVSYYNNELITSIEPLSVISSKKEIVKLSKKNFPVTSENASQLVSFLYHFKYANEERLKPKRASSQLGWQGDGFLFPDRAINSSGELESGYFVGSDPPINAYASKGDRQTYINFIREIGDNLKGYSWIIPVFVVYAALASFIIELLDANILLLHFNETTGSGKTSLMRLAASAYGRYNYHNSWNDTATGLVRKAVKLKNFPLLINEGSIVEEQKGLAALLYTLSEGQSRAKATMDSTNETTVIKHFYNVIISNGETSLLTGREPAGVMMRVIEFMETLGGQNHKFIEKLENTIKNNYGLLIEPFIKKVIELRDGKGSIKIKRDGKVIEIKSLYDFPYFADLDTTDEPNSGNFNRKLKALQPVYIAGCIAEDLFDFGYDPVEVVGYIFDMNRRYIIESVNRAKRVMNGLRDFYQEHRSKFIDLISESADIYTQNEENEEKVLKTVEKANKTIYGYVRGQELMLIPSVFSNQFLKGFSNSDGKNAGVILKELREEGYIITDKGRYQKTVRIGKNTEKLIFFPEFFNCANEIIDFSESYLNTENCSPFGGQ